MLYLPQIHNEHTTLCRYLDVQLDAIRASAYGLEDEQARQCPLRSDLSISGLLKHTVFVMRQSLSGAGHSEHDQPDDAFFTSFTPTEEETLDALLSLFDAVRADYTAMCREGDLDAVVELGPMPWVGLDEPRSAALRYQYVHHIEEFARHAGHADLIREQIDGAQAVELQAAVEGLPANEYVTPWGQ